MRKSVFTTFKHNHGSNMLPMMHLQGIQIPQAHLQLIQAFFLHNPDIFGIIQKPSRLPRYIFRSSRLFLENPDTFFDFPDTFYIIWKLSSSFRHFLDHLDTFQIIRTLLRSSGNFPVHPDILHIIWILCIVLVHFQNIWKFFSQ